MTTQRTTYEPIPQPPGYPMLGNLFDVRGADTVAIWRSGTLRKGAAISLGLHAPLVASFARPQPSLIVVVGALLFIVGATLVALDVFRGLSRGSARTKRAR